MLLVEHAQLQALIANIIAFLVAVQFSYWGHCFLTFRENALHHIMMPKFFLVQTCNFIFNECLFYIFLSLHFSYRLALLIVLTTLPLITFTISKLWIFKKT